MTTLAQAALPAGGPQQPRTAAPPPAPQHATFESLASRIAHAGSAALRAQGSLAARGTASGSPVSGPSSSSSASASTSSPASSTSSFGGAFWCLGAPSVDGIASASAAVAAAEPSAERYRREAMRDDSDDYKDGNEADNASESGSDSAGSDGLPRFASPSSSALPPFRTTEWVDSPFLAAAAAAAAASAVAAAGKGGVSPEGLRDDSAREDGGDEPRRCSSEKVRHCPSFFERAHASSPCESSSSPLSELRLPFSPGRGEGEPAAGGESGAAPLLFGSAVAASPPKGDAVLSRLRRRQQQQQQGAAASPGMRARSEDVPASQRPGARLTASSQPRRGSSGRSRGGGGGGMPGAGSGGGSAGGAEWKHTQTLLVSSLVKSLCSSAVGPSWLRGLRQF